MLVKDFIRERKLSEGDVVSDGTYQWRIQRDKTSGDFFLFCLTSSRAHIGVKALERVAIPGLHIHCTDTTVEETKKFIEANPPSGAVEPVQALWQQFRKQHEDSFDVMTQDELQPVINNFVKFACKYVHHSVRTSINEVEGYVTRNTPSSKG